MLSVVVILVVGGGGEVEVIDLFTTAMTPQVPFRDPFIGTGRHDLPKCANL